MNALEASPQTRSIATELTPFITDCRLSWQLKEAERQWRWQGEKEKEREKEREREREIEKGR